MSEDPALPREASRTPDTPTGGIGSQKRWIVASLMLAMSVASLEQTVVSPAMPSIISELNGVDLYPWVFSVYLLAATVSTPLYGKLADLWGRKRLLLFGLGLFSLGSALSGLSWSMPSLIVFRLLQGLGAGAIMPIVLTILGDVFTLDQRARVQGWFSAVWGLSSLIGPTIGGELTDNVSWRFVFLVTLPFSLIAALVLTWKFQEKRETRHAQGPIKLDWVGAGLLAVATSSLLFGVLGQDRASQFIPAWAWLSISAISAILFLYWEKRAEEPILPLDLFSNRTVAAGIFGSFLMGSVVFGIDTYIPLYIQGVLGGRATDAGRMLIPLFMAWAISVTVAAKIVKRLGFRRTAFVGNSLISLGMLSLVVGASNPRWVVVFFLVGHLVIGFGMGPTSLSYILAVQNVVNWDRRGVATGAVSFFRTIGGALGVGILGAVLAWGLAHKISSPDEIATVLESRGQAENMAEGPVTSTPYVSTQAREALGSTLRDMLGMLLAVSVLSLGCARQLPDRAATNRPAPAR